MGRHNSEPSNGSSGHAGGTSPGQTRKKQKDLSAREREEGGCGEGVGVCMLCTCVSEEGGGRGEYGLRSSISAVIHTQVRQFHGLGQTLTVGVSITDAPVYMRE